jgi:hypothetical protein
VQGRAGQGRAGLRGFSERGAAHTLPMQVDRPCLLLCLLCALLRTLLLTLLQFLHNVSINLKEGGYFIGTVPDGKRINDCIRTSVLSASDPPCCCPACRLLSPCQPQLAPTQKARPAAVLPATLLPPRLHAPCFTLINNPTNHYLSPHSSPSSLAPSSLCPIAPAVTRPTHRRC